MQELIASVPSNGRFLYGAVSSFTPQDTMAFFESLGVPVKTERGNRVFPVSDHAKGCFRRAGGLGCRAGLRGSPGNGAEPPVARGPRGGRAAPKRERKFFAGAVLIACGGAFHPATGSTGDGYRLAEQAGHTVTPLRPSLVPLVAQGRIAAS